MKKIAFLLILFVVISVCVHGQHPLIGTWEMVSIKGISAAGEKFSADTSTIREVKIITATHYMLVAHDVENDSLVFNRCYAGSVKIDGNKYIEVPMLSSVPIFDNVKTDFTWKVDGDRFIQAGTLIRPDGKQVVLEELVFKRVKTPQAYPTNSANGTWKLLTSSYTDTDGKSRSDAGGTVTAYQLITPTHWMYASSRDKKFEHVMGGSYTMKGDKYSLYLDFSSFPKSKWGKTEMTVKLQGDKLQSVGTSQFPDGKKFTWNDSFQKVK